MSEDETSPMDLTEFKKEQTEILDSNLHKHKGDKITYPYEGHTDQGKTATKPGLRFGIKLQHRVLIESELTRRPHY